MRWRGDSTVLTLTALLSLFLLVGGYVDPPPPPPSQTTISLVPPPGASVNRTVTLTANAVAAAGINLVELLVDGTVVGTSTMTPYTFAWDTSTLADGAHSLTARLTDAANNVVTSTAVAVTINNNPTINVALSPDEIFPKPTSTAAGSGAITFNLLTGAIAGGVSSSGMTATTVNIQQAAAGATGPTIVTLAQNAADPNRWDAPAGTLLTADQINALLAGALYVNAASATFPNGEIRGQIKPDNIQVVFTAMNGDMVVPPVTTAASGIAATTIDSVAATATVHINATGVDDATEAHVHQAAVGANNAAVLIALTKDSVTPSHWSVERQPVAAADLTLFTSGAWYVDLHTPANPGGAIRGQITPAATLTQLQTSIFTPRCAACHTGTGGSLPGSMNLSTAANSFAALVGVASQEQPAVLRVQPGSPDNSYVVLKLEGAPGISGSQMPLGGPFLDQATIDRVRSWIAAGAANN